ncbi:hypothetical protein LLE87_31210, partial [Paenibacillus polymyxa]|nr:hypothetical protein [Paenibacillus polymyxa]
RGILKGRKPLPPCSGQKKRPENGALLCAGQGSDPKARMPRLICPRFESQTASHLRQINSVVFSSFGSSTAFHSGFIQRLGSESQTTKKQESLLFT